MKILPFAFHNAGYLCLEWLLDNGYDVPLVVTHKPYKKENVWFNSVYDLAKKRGVQVVLGEECEEVSLVSKVQSAEPDILFSINYRKIIPESIYKLPQLGSYNAHDSLLPAYKGFAPSIWVIIKGETKTGITIHEIVDEVDAGDIVGQIELSIPSHYTGRDMIEDIAVATKELFIRTVHQFENGTAVKTAQNSDQGFWMNRRGPKDDWISWDQTSEEIYNFVRAITWPIACARTRYQEKDIYIWKAEQCLGANNGKSPPGTVLSKDKDGIVVQTANGVVKIVEIGLVPEYQKRINLRLDEFPLSIGGVLR